MNVPIDKLITSTPKPDFDKEVLAPLRAKQAAGARLARERVSAEEARQRQLEQEREVQPAQVLVSPGSHTDWVRAAGIDPVSWGYVDYIVTRESGWNPCAYNPGQSNCSAMPTSACGIGQQLPCGKWAGAWNDPVAGLRGMDGYVKARYGGWAGAYQYWTIHGNY